MRIGSYQIVLVTEFLTRLALNVKNNPGLPDTLAASSRSHVREIVQTS